MLRKARRHLFTILEHAGIFRVVANTRWRGRRLLILCYHGVSIADEHEWHPELYVSPAVLRQRFGALRRGGYNVLPLGEAVDRLAAGTLPPKSVAITFDDGGYDFYARAYPLLREYGFPATVYLTTYYSYYQRPVFDTGSSYVLWRGRGSSPLDLSDLIPGSPPMCLDTERGRRAAALRIRDYANSEDMSGEKKDRLLRRIAQRAGVDYEAVFGNRLLFLMTPNEVREVAAGGVDVQLHTHRHRTPHERQLFLREIDDNRGSIEAILGPGRREHFCYPSGVYTDEFLEWLPHAGVSSATTCDNALATSADNRLLLPRLVDTMNVAPVQFGAWLSGVADLVPHRRRAKDLGGHFSRQALQPTRL
ncbi:MAG: polysaccharide deacetylase family protein [Bacteroidales bacterium]